MYGHGQTAPSGVLDGQVDSLCHILLQGGGTQLAPYQEAAGLKAALMLSVKHAYPHTVVCQG